MAGGLLVFASVLSDAYLDRPRNFNIFPKSVKNISQQQQQQLTFDYRYGWSFFAAGAAFVMSEVAALLSITAYVRRFPSVEDMVRIMVPGAERKLRQHYMYNDCVVRRNAEQEPVRRKAEAAAVPSRADGQLMGNKTPPDICTTNNKNNGGEDTKSSAGEYPNLAGTTVPITLMHHKPTVPFSNHVPARQQSSLGAKQDFRYATIGHCTLVHQGVLGVSEGAPGTSSSSGSSASSGNIKY